LPNAWITATNSIVVPNPPDSSRYLRILLVQQDLKKLLAQNSAPFRGSVPRPVKSRYLLYGRIQQDVRTNNARRGFRKHAKINAEEAMIFDREMVKAASLNDLT
jgi:hypothetical protein